MKMGPLPRKKSGIKTSLFKRKFRLRRLATAATRKRGQEEFWEN